MGKNNPTNPWSTDDERVKKSVTPPIEKAEVLDVKDHPEELKHGESAGFHTARVKVYGDNAPHDAAVLTPSIGSVWVPEEGDDVMVAYLDGGKPLIIGAWYPLDRVEDGEQELPAYESGDIRLGNSSGSGITVDNNGDVRVETGDNDFLVDGNTTSGTYSDEDAQDAIGAIASSQFTYDDANNVLNINPHASTTDAHHSRYTDEEAQDAVGAALSSSFTYDDTNNAINISPHLSDAAAHHSRYTDEEAQDTVSALLSGGTGITLTYDDTNNTLTIDGHSRYTDEEAQDATNALLSGGTGVTLTYDDTNNTLTIDGHSRYTDEEAQDTVSALLSGGTGIALTYDDTNNTLTIDGHSRYTDEEAQDAIGAIVSTQFTYDDTNNVLNINPHVSTTDAHHTRYSDSEARTVAEGVEKFSYSTGHTAWGATSSAENVNRIDLQSGESFKPQRLDVQLKGGGSNTSFSVDVYDATNSTVLLSTTAGSVAQNGTESPTGATIVVRVDNATGSTKTASITANGVIR